MYIIGDIRGLKMYPLNLSKGMVYKVGFKIIDHRQFSSKVIGLDGFIWLESEMLKEDKYFISQSKCVDIKQAESFMFSDGYR